MSVALSSSDSAVIDRTIELNEQFKFTDLESSFELDRVESWIRENGFENVALQFPDSLLSYAPNVAQSLEKRLEMRISILGDTSYGECCVDEVACQHIGADAVIHFGNTCLTQTQQLPVLFVFTVLPLDIEKLKSEIKSNFNEKIHLFYDVRYHKAIVDVNGLNELVHVWQPCQPDMSNPRIKCGRISSTQKDVEKDEKILYIGNADQFIFLLSLTFNENQVFLYRDDKIQTASISANKELMRRFYLIEKARDAQRVGVLVGTLGVSRYSDIIDRILATLSTSGKKAYTFLVGKPNVPKLANFPEIDLFVLVTCPEMSLVRSREFMQPVITPYELDIALNKDRQWGQKFLANFQDILPGMPDFKEFQPEDDQDVSLITGKLRNSAKLSESNESRELSQQETQLVHQNGGGEFLTQRSWRGLEQKLGETKVKKAELGRSGIAFGYKGEGE